MQFGSIIVPLTKFGLRVAELKIFPARLQAVFFFAGFCPKPRENQANIAAGVAPAKRAVRS